MISSLSKELIKNKTGKKTEVNQNPTVNHINHHMEGDRCRIEIVEARVRLTQSGGLAGQSGEIRNDQQITIQEYEKSRDHKNNKKRRE